MKQKRIRKVWPSDQVLHLWANQSQSDARSANVFFEGDTVYSYGYHYKLGRIHTIKGKRVALINSYQYSHTTNKHRCMARAAVSHMHMLVTSDVTNISTAISENQETLVTNLMDLFGKRSFYRPWDKPRGMPYGIERVLDSIDNYNAFCDAVGQSKQRIDVPAHFIDLLREHADTCIKRDEALKAERLTPEGQARLEAARAKRERLEATKAERQIQKWREGGPLFTDVRKLSPQLLRVRGDVVETSRGAVVPLNLAVLMYRRIKSGRAQAGDKVGAFTYSGQAPLNPAAHEQAYAVRIGCHLIALAEADTVLGALQPALSVVSNEQETA